MSFRRIVLAGLLFIDAWFVIVTGSAIVSFWLSAVGPVGIQAWLERFESILNEIGVAAATIVTVAYLLWQRRKPSPRTDALSTTLILAAFVVILAFFLPRYVRRSTYEGSRGHSAEEAVRSVLREHFDAAKVDRIKLRVLAKYPSWSGWFDSIRYSCYEDDRDLAWISVGERWGIWWGSGQHEFFQPPRVIEKDELR